MNVNKELQPDAHTSSNGLEQRAGAGILAPYFAGGAEPTPKQPASQRRY
jgi:hypothetical protein